MLCLQARGSLLSIQPTAGRNEYHLLVKDGSREKRSRRGNHHLESSVARGRKLPPRTRAVALRSPESRRQSVAGQPGGGDLLGAALCALLPDTGDSALPKQNRSEVSIEGSSEWGSHVGSGGPHSGTLAVWWPRHTRDVEGQSLGLGALSARTLRAQWRRGSGLPLGTTVWETLKSLSVSSLRAITVPGRGQANKGQASSRQRGEGCFVLLGKLGEDAEVMARLCCETLWNAFCSHLN